MTMTQLQFPAVLALRWVTVAVLCVRVHGLVLIQCLGAWSGWETHLGNLLYLHHHHCCVQDYHARLGGEGEGVSLGRSGRRCGRSGEERRDGGVLEGPSFPPDELLPLPPFVRGAVNILLPLP
jgi:hypothetical protein